MSKRNWLVVALVALVFGIGGFLVGTRASAGSDENAANWLFSQTADTGTIAPNGDGTWTLTLSDVDPTYIAFTDRPVREASLGDLPLLVDQWGDLFADSDPNAVVVAHNEAGDTNSAVVQLSDPVLDGSTLTYTARVLTNEGGPAEPGVTYDFGQVSVFIDDVDYIWRCIDPVYGGVIEPPEVFEGPVYDQRWAANCQLSKGVPKSGPPSR